MVGDVPLADFKAVMDVNVSASFLCAREAFKIFKAQDPQGGKPKFGPRTINVFRPPFEQGASSIMAQLQHTFLVHILHLMPSQNTPSQA